MSRFRIDETSLYDELGAAKIVELSTAFYTRVYADPDPQWRGLFPDDMQSAIQNQYEFFIQRLGGPPLYTQRKGHPALRARHARFHIPKEFAARWVRYMSAALDDVGIGGDTADKLMEFFTDTAFFLQNVGDEGQRLY